MRSVAGREGGDGGHGPSWCRPPASPCSHASSRPSERPTGRPRDGPSSLVVRGCPQPGDDASAGLSGGGERGPHLGLLPRPTPLSPHPTLPPELSGERRPSSSPPLRAASQGGGHAAQRLWNQPLHFACQAGNLTRGKSCVSGGSFSQKPAREKSRGGPAAERGTFSKFIAGIHYSWAALGRPEPGRGPGGSGKAMAGGAGARGRAGRADGGGTEGEGPWPPTPAVNTLSCSRAQPPAGQGRLRVPGAGALSAV